MVKVILLGDSIRMGYQPVVARKLGKSAEVWGPQENVRDSSRLLANLEEWALERDPDVIHFNCGMHDLKFQDGAYQVPIEEYVRNLKTIVTRLREETEARLIWASTTPVDDEVHRRRDPGYSRTDADAVRYNKAALSIMQKAGVEVNDLYEVIQHAGVVECVSREDGVHVNDTGKELLADAVARAIGR